MTTEAIDLHARHSDPETSKEAAAMLTDNQAKMRRSVQAVVAILGELHEASDFAIRDAWPRHFTQEKWSEGLPRMARLWAQREGKVVQAGFTTHNGRRCRTWRIGTAERVVVVTRKSKARERIVELERQVAAITDERDAAVLKLARWGRPPNTVRQARALERDQAPRLL